MSNEATRNALRNELNLDPDAHPVQLVRGKPRIDVVGHEPFLGIKHRSMVGADFSDLDLKFAVFHGCDLSSADFSRCNLFKASFEDCILYNVRFDKAMLVDVNFKGAKLFGVRFQGAEIYGMGGVGGLMSREYYDPEKSMLMFRGTAGCVEWGQLSKMEANEQWFKVLPLLSKVDHIEYTKYGKKSSNGDADGETRLLGSTDCEEVVEICELHTNTLYDRFEDGDRSRSFASPPGDAWPEDATAMMLRGYRECLEQQGRDYPASRARFWEKAYQAATRIRTVQSKVMKADAQGKCSVVRWMLGLPLAWLAWSLLHPKDEHRRLCATGRRFEPSVMPKAIVGILEGRWILPSLGWRVHCPEDLSVWITFGVHLFSLLGFVVIGSALLFVQLGFIPGILVGMVVPCILAAPLSFNFLAARPCKRHWVQQWKDGTLDIILASYQFAQHTLCGSGERPGRAIAALAGWVLAFGCIYQSWISPDNFYFESLDLTGQPRKEWSSTTEPHHYSFLVTSMLGFIKVMPKTDEAVRLVCVEVFGAILLTAILTATLTRKFIGR